MADHQIEFLEHDRSSYRVMIDGQVVKLTKVKNNIKYGNSDALSDFVDALGDRLASGDCFSELSTIANGCNMLVILGSIYHDDTLKRWEVFYRDNGQLSFYRSFKKLFGYKHDLKNCPSNFVNELLALSEKIQKDSLWLSKLPEEKKRKFREYAQDNPEVYVVNYDQWKIERIPGNENNVISFLVNGENIDICVAHKKENADPHRLLNVICTLQTGLQTFDEAKVKQCINDVGAAATLRIMRFLFHSESICFFSNSFELFVKEKRNVPYPSKFLKSFFQGNAYKDKMIIPEILDTLEEAIPDLEDYLIQSSESEVQSDNDEWVLYYRNNGHLLCKRLVFFGPPSLKQELRCFLRFNTESHMNSGKNYAKVAYSMFNDIRSILKNISPLPNSVSELDRWHIRSSIAAIRANNSISLATERRALYDLKVFIAFHAGVDHANRIISDSVIPPRVISPTKPVDHHVIEQILFYSDVIPRCVYLALKVFLQTGARLDCICSMLTSQLTHRGDRWHLKLFYGKTEDRDGKAGRPSYRIHDLADGLGPELEKFIHDTEKLRAQLDDPYVFIYESSNNRKDSKRKPKILSGNSFIESIEKLCKKHQIVDSEGMPAKCNSMMIRAEVGRGMLAQGKSIHDTADKLCNSCIVVAMHYNKRYPVDEAKMHRALFSKTLDNKIGKNVIPTKDSLLLPNAPMYGTCHSNIQCHNHNDCRTCSIAIQCKNAEKGA